MWLLLKNSAAKQTPVCDHSGLTIGYYRALPGRTALFWRESQSRTQPSPPHRAGPAPTPVCLPSPGGSILRAPYQRPGLRHCRGTSTKTSSRGPGQGIFSALTQHFSTLTFRLSLSLSQTLQIHKKAGSSGMIVSPICAAPLPEAVPWERVDTGGQGHSWPLAYSVTINK